MQKFATHQIFATHLKLVEIVGIEIYLKKYFFASDVEPNTVFFEIDAQRPETLIFALTN